ncbi:unnamed protein product [Arabis nemorensis]|uniref:BZIP domain-containing protein n=1 Tax=Arabis nemorensis TaxID=586526 RepID=A0A565B2N4_9BRAS|nr:unnamed protein product [Arabis nemorensis]
MKNVDLPSLIVPGYTQSSNEDDGGDTGRRTVVTPSSGSSHPRISPYSRISTIQQQLELQNFSPGPNIPSSMSQPSPIYSSSLPPRSPSSALFPSFHPSAPLSDYDPSLLPSGNAHKRRNTTDGIAFGSHRESQVYTDDMEQSLDLDNENMGVGSTNSGVKRRAGKGIAPSSSSRLTKSASAGNLTAAEMDKIKGDKKLTELAATCPYKARRMLANRESAARSQKKKEKYIVELEDQVQDLRAENTTIRAMYNQLRSDLIAVENELKEVKIRHDGLEKQVELHQDLHVQKNARISELTNELAQYRGEANRSIMQHQSLNPNMFQQLNINQTQGNPDFDGHI